MKSGDVTFDGGATVNLDARDEGDYAGLLIYAPLSNSGTVRMNGNATSTFEGSILAPASTIVMYGTGNTTGFHSQLVGYQVILSGTSDSYIHYEDEKNYDLPKPPQIELTQ